MIVFFHILHSSCSRPHLYLPNSLQSNTPGLCKLRSPLLLPNTIHPRPLCLANLLPPRFNWPPLPYIFPPSRFITPLPLRNVKPNIQRHSLIIPCSPVLCPCPLPLSDSRVILLRYSGYSRTLFLSFLLSFSCSLLGGSTKVYFLGGYFNRKKPFGKRELASLRGYVYIKDLYISDVFFS